MIRLYMDVHVRREVTVGFRRRMAAANNAATSTHHILLVAPRPRLPVTAASIEPEVSRPISPCTYSGRSASVAGAHFSTSLPVSRMVRDAGGSRTPLLSTTEIYVSRGGWHTLRDLGGQI
jgi:hypothetical protein